MNTTHKNSLNNEKGFTLVEVIAVLIILGILAAVAVPKYIGLEDQAKERAIDAAISELNGRESMYWAKLKISNATTTPYTAATIDGAVWTEMTAVVAGSNVGTDLNVPGGPLNYVWSVAPTNGASGGGTLKFQGSKDYVLKRSEATLERPASWTR